MYTHTFWRRSTTFGTIIGR